MSSETPPGPPEDRPSDPFARGRIVWGRPPQAVFQVGPLPRSAPVAPPRPAPPRPARPAGAGILSGSMVPPARPAAEPVAPVEADVAVFEPLIESPPQPPEPELTPEPAPAAPLDLVVEPEAPEPALTAPPPLSAEVPPAAEPRKLPSVVVTPAIYATVGAALEKVSHKDRWLVFAGIAAVLVTGAFIWLATLPAPRPVDRAPTPALAAPPPFETPPVAEVEAEAAVPATRPAPVRAEPAPAAPVAAEPVAPARPRAQAPAASAPVAVAPVEAAAPTPRIETAPLVVEPPTAAAPAQSDPEAPIATRPQPLD